MKKVQVRIKGIVPLLQHRFPEEEHGANNSKKKSKVYDPETEAKKALYQNDQIGIYQPAEHLLCAMVRAGTSFKYEGKRTYKDIISCGIAIEPDCIPLHKERKDYTIDARNAVVKRQRIIRWRPRFEEWELEFDIVILDDQNISVSTLKEILETAGQWGIGDYRPRFGRFQVTEWREL